MITYDIASYQMISYDIASNHIIWYYIIYHISYHITSHHIIWEIIWHTIWYIMPYYITYIIYHIIPYHISHTISKQYPKQKVHILLTTSYLFIAFRHPKVACDSVKFTTEHVWDQYWFFHSAVNEFFGIVFIRTYSKRIGPWDGNIRPPSNI